MTQIVYEDDDVCSLHRLSSFNPYGNSPVKWKTFAGFIDDMLEALADQVGVRRSNGVFIVDEVFLEFYDQVDSRRSSFLMCVTTQNQTVANGHFKTLVAKHGWTSVTSPRTDDSAGDLTIWLTTIGQFHGMCRKMFPVTVKANTEVVRAGKAKMNKIYRSKQ